jgi:hypothetical protein
MSWRSLNSRQFFHGTTAELRPGDSVLPTSQTGAKPVFRNESDSRHAYATTNQADAWDYAELSWHASTTGVPHVYEVEPLGRHSKDPEVDKRGRRRGNHPEDRRSKVGWQVVGEVPMPEDMGEPEDWR